MEMKENANFEATMHVNFTALYCLFEEKRYCSQYKLAGNGHSLGPAFYMAQYFIP